MTEDKEKEIKKITDAIVKKYKPEKIFLFGSFAWGNPTKDSDVDLFIVKKSNKSSRELAREIDESLVERKLPIDILVYSPKEVKRSINEYKSLFIEDILRHGKIIYKKPFSFFKIKLPERPLNILH